MSSYDKGKLSIERKGLRYKLLIIEALIFVLPFFIISYISYRNNIILEFSQIIIFALTLILILGGLIILRQIFNRFSALANLIKKAESADSYLTEIEKDTAELHEITVSFNRLRKKFEEATDELRRRVFELFAIKELTEIASRVLDIHDLLNVLLEKAMAVTKAQIGSVFMVESEKHRFRVVASRGSESGPQKDSYISISESLAEHIVSRGKPLFVQDIETDPMTWKQIDPKHSPPSSLSMPIFVKENLIALLNLSHWETEQVFDSNDEQILSIMIGEIGFALESAELHSRIQEHLKHLQERTVELTNANDQLQQEITERKQAEEALEETNKFLRNILDSSSSISIISTDMEGNILFWNKGAEDIFGYKTEEVVGCKKIDILYPDDEARKAINKTRELILKNKEAISSEIREVTKDGRKLWINLNLTPRLDEEGRVVGILGIGEDSTERKHLEEELRQAHKMEAIGTLAGGIAHDFNNILSAIMGYTEVASAKIPERSRAERDLKEVLKASRRAKDLVRQILTFTRQTDQERKPVKIAPIVKETLKLLRASLPSNIEIRQHIEADPGTIETNPTQIHQVLMNLCANAHYAMQEDGGVLEVSLTRIDLDAGSELLGRDMPPGPYLRLKVSDTGHGMPPDVLRRIFEPYFSTKEKGEGTGLGLSLVHGIVKSHGGIITVESEPEKGTSFHVYFPLIEDTKEAEIMEEREEVEPTPTGHERILFIDDEQPLVNIAKDMLERYGYEVVARTSSIKALELFRAHPDRFNLVITDMTMPNMTGDKLSREVMRMRPDMPIILCTGYSERITEEQAKAMGIREFVMKPLVMSDLAKTIRRVLDKK